MPCARRNLPHHRRFPAVHLASPRRPVHTDSVRAESERPTLLVMTRGGGEYVRARRMVDGVYEVEHVEGMRRRSLYTPDVRLVRDILVSWIADDGWWCSAVAWAEVDPAVAELDALRAEMEAMLTEVQVFDGLAGEFDAVLARADELLGDLP